MLGEAARRLLDAERRAMLVTIGRQGRPRPVPVCYAVLGETIVTPIDAKPKRGTDPRDLARLRDIAADSRVSLLVDHWDEDWRRLAWIRIEGEAHVIEPGADGHAAALSALRARYAQYAGMPLEDLPVIEIRPARAVSWSAAHP
ncbi:MAG: TIGR03668 family PPOX class F420-dependent oxidoreductase [Chloroflexi bacterium]|nr:TIGR03668 family PPOX class F420-dependent oxidoreductase [Chloroflexota bacterium]